MRADRPMCRRRSRLRIIQASMSLTTRVAKRMKPVRSKEARAKPMRMNRPVQMKTLQVGMLQMRRMRARAARMKSVWARAARSDKTERCVEVPNPGNQDTK